MNDTATNPQVTPSGLELADRLERLLQLPLGGPSHIQPWTDACAEVQSWLGTHAHELPFELPHHLVFYFHDPDIRAKEPGYKASQEQGIRRLIKQLRGEEPPDIKRPWWRFW
jgi:hypothetical protein